VVKSEYVPPDGLYQEINEKQMRRWSSSFVLCLGLLFNMWFILIIILILDTSSLGMTLVTLQFLFSVFEEFVLK
jgi:hypothetical protein